MKQNINIEVEGSELILKNKAGDYVIIPKKYRTEVQDMIKDGCHGCIDNLVNTLPTLSDYAKDGTIIPKNKTILTAYLEPDDLRKSINKNPIIPVDNTNTRQRTNQINDKVIQQKNKSYYNSTKYIKPKQTPTNKTVQKKENTQYDQMSDYMKQHVDIYNERVENPGFLDQTREAVELIPRYAENPLKFVGDLLNTVAPNSPFLNDLPTTSKERYDRRKYLYDPLLDYKEKLIKSNNEAFDMVPGILQNLAIPEFGYLFNGYLSPILKEAATMGSFANLSGNVYEIYRDIKTGNIDNYLNDPNFGINFLLNTTSLFTKFDNFDASTVYYNLKNWSNISKDDKIDTFKDVYNLLDAARNQK